MKRRTAISGTGLVLGTTLGGCLSDIDGESDPAAANAEPQTACETGRAVIEAIGAAEYERAADYVPAAYFSTESTVDEARTNVVEHYRAMRSPDAVRAIKCIDTTPNQGLVESLSAESNTTVTDAVDLTYTADIEIGTDSIESTLQVSAVEIDGQWYAWLDGELVPSIDADVTVDKAQVNTATVTYTSGQEGVELYVVGPGIDDQTAYRLGVPGDTVTLSVDDVGSGTYTVIGTWSASEWGARATIIEEFSLVESATWADVEGIRFRAMTTSWVGKHPTHIEGVNNPTLILERGREYRIGWNGGNGAAHNLELRNSDGEVVDDYSTELTMEPDESQFLTVTATDELATYRCAPHSPMEGKIEVVDEL